MATFPRSLLSQFPSPVKKQEQQYGVVRVITVVRGRNAESGQCDRYSAGLIYSPLGGGESTQ